MDSKKKLRVGWYSFSCCEDSTIIFTELLNDYYKEWKKVIEFTYFLPLQKREDWSFMDVAFIEGAVTEKEQEEKVKKIRVLAKKVIAIGACACIGMPSGQRNTFDEATKKEIEAIMIRFSYAEKVKKIADVITVDGMVPGCPMDEKKFLDILVKTLKEFDITA